MEGSLYWVDRTSSEFNQTIHEFLFQNTRRPKMLSITGRPGIGKSSLILDYLDIWKQSSDLVLVFNEDQTIYDSTQLVNLCLRKIPIGSIWTSVTEIKNKPLSDEEQDLAENCSRIHRALINIDHLTDAIHENLKNIGSVWVVLDNASAHDPLILNWLKTIIEKNKNNIDLRIIRILEELDVTKNIHFDHTHEMIRIEPFSNEELSTFYNDAIKGDTAISLLTIEQVSKLTDNIPLWLQWLANCPKDWFRHYEDGYSLSKNFLNFLANEDQFNFLARLAFCFYFDETDLYNLCKNPLDVSWLLKSTLLINVPGKGLILHPQISYLIKQNIQNKQQPHLEVKYRKDVYDYYHEKIRGKANWFYLPNALGVLKNLSKNAQTEWEYLAYKHFVIDSILELILYNPIWLDKVVSNLDHKDIKPLIDIKSSLLKRSWASLSMSWMQLFKEFVFDKVEQRARYLAILGFFLYLADKNADAKQKLKEALSYSAADFVVYWVRGLIMEDERDWNSAIIEFTEAIRIQPKFVHSYNERGSMYFKLNRDKSAIDDFSKAVELKPSFVHALVNLGVLYYRLNEIERSTLWFQKALSIDTQETKAYVALISNINIDRIIKLN